MKKPLMPTLIVVIVIQLLYPIVSIIDNYNIIKNGEEFKFIVEPIDPYDAFRGRYVELNVSRLTFEEGKYGLVEVDSLGFAYISRITTKKPESGTYIESGSEYYFYLPISRYYMQEKLAPLAEEITRLPEFSGLVYVTVRVKNGKAIVTGLFVDGVAIEDFLKAYQTD